MTLESAQGYTLSSSSSCSAPATSCSMYFSIGRFSPAGDYSVTQLSISSPSIGWVFRHIYRGMKWHWRWRWTWQLFYRRSNTFRTSLLYYAQDLISLGIGTYLFSTYTTPDHTPPVATGYDFPVRGTQWSLQLFNIVVFDVNTTNQIAQCIVAATDDLSGLNYFQFYFTRLSGPSYNPVYNLYASTTPNATDFFGYFTFLKKTPSGNYSLSQIAAYDNAGNQRVYSNISSLQGNPSILSSVS
jgi:hypothetical protein